MKAILFALALAACNSCTPPQPPAPPVVMQGDAGPSPCAAACNQERQLHCPLGNPTPKGATCETVCLAHRDLGGQLPWDTACMAKATNCEECQ